MFEDTIERIMDSVQDTVSTITDEFIAVMVVGCSMYAYLTGIDMPTEPLMLVLAYYFVKSTQ